MCEQYRMSLMALADGELSGSDRHELEEHLNHCAYCNEEYNDILRLNQDTSDALAEAVCRHSEWDAYYRAVCVKIESQATWAAWSIVSLLLVLAGTLLIFGCEGAVLATLAGAIALGSGAALVVVSFVCNSCSR